MKKFLLFLASAMGIVAFCMMFLANLTLTTESFLGTTTNPIAWNDVLFGAAEIKDLSVEVKASTLPFVGYIMAIASGAILIISLIFINKKNKLLSLVSFVAGAVMIVGGIFILCTLSTFTSTNKDLIDALELLNTTVSMDAPIVIGGILGILGGVTSVASIFIRK